MCLTGCIRENIDDCETPVDLEFQYFGNGIVDIFPDRIDSVLMYVYELPSGRLHQTMEISREELAVRQGADLRLIPGDYRIVCWGNAGEGSAIDTEGKVITSSEYAGGDVPSGIEELYFGTVDLNVPLTLQAVKETVVYEASYIMMKVELLGFAALRSAGVLAMYNGENSAADATVSLTHGNHSALIDFTNTPSDEVTDYVPVLYDHPDEDASYVADYLVPRFDNGTEARLSIVRNDNGEAIYDRPLSDIMDNLDITVDERNEQMVNIRFRLAQSEDGELTIDVIGWNTEIVFPEL
ncbi:MAG: hypothetical protein BHV78_07815 [Bacteroides sp. CAG:1060_57_27]|nr:MAG: hypothetical protein BHV78_07815 [Bacteroides sp. CAG:1060_57_27]